MDEALSRKIEALLAELPLDPPARAELSNLIGAALDSRFAATVAPAEPPPATAGHALEDLGLLGRGAMGEVRRVRDPDLGRIVALKQLSNPAAEAWFEREVRILASLEHPAILPLYARGRAPDGTPWFTMPQVHGRTLHDVLTEGEAWPLRRLVEVVRRVADALGHAHSRGVVHRDVTPGNVLVGDRGEVLPVDWGLALRVGEGADRPSGTPASMAPEQAGGAPADPRVDVWALGRVLFEVLGVGPWRGPASLARLEGRPPAELSALAAACLSAEPEGRPADGGAVAHALADWLDGVLRADPAREALGRALALRIEADGLREREWEERPGRVSLCTDPPGARVLARPCRLVGRRLEPGPARPLGTTPLLEVEMPAGSWLVEIRAEGRAPVRYPVALDRGEHWHGVPPGGAEPFPIHLPLPEELGPEDHYVPAGWFSSGAVSSPAVPPPAARWVDGVVIRRFALTNGELIGLLDRLVALGRGEEALRVAPREKASRPEAEGELVYAFDGVRFSLAADAEGDTWRARWPVMLVRRDDAQAIAAALAELDGLGWRLPWALEIEKAARGVDGRTFPWGEHLDPSFSARRGSFAGGPRPQEVDAFPFDEGPYGVRGLFGTVRTWTLDQEGELAGAIGSYWNALGRGHVANRYWSSPLYRGMDIGLRLVRSLGGRAGP